MRPEHFEKRKLCIYISKAIICLFSANTFWSNLWSKRKRPEVLRGAKCGSFQQQVPCSEVAASLVVAIIIQVTDFKCHHYPATSAVSQVAKWQWEVGIFTVSLASVLHPYCKMFDSIGSYLSNFHFRKRKHVENKVQFLAPSISKCLSRCKSIAKEMGPYENLISILG